MHGKRTLLLSLLLVSCGLAAFSLPGDAAPVVKLGVIGPFEGRGRDLGYAVLPAIKEAVAEANASGSLGRYRVTVAAFNDNLDPVTAGEQALALGLDRDVFGVVGPFSPGTAAAAEPVLRRSHLANRPLPQAYPANGDFSQEQAQAKEAARSLLQALAADIHANGRPTGRSIPNP